MLNAMCVRPPWANPEVMKRQGCVSPTTGANAMSRVSEGCTVCSR